MGRNGGRWPRWIACLLIFFPVSSVCPPSQHNYQHILWLHVLWITQEIDRLELSLQLQLSHKLTLHLDPASLAKLISPGNKLLDQEECDDPTQPQFNSSTTDTKAD